MIVLGNSRVSQRQLGLLVPHLVPPLRLLRPVSTAGSYIKQKIMYRILMYTFTVLYFAIQNIILPYIAREVLTDDLMCELVDLVALVVLEGFDSSQTAALLDL